MFHHRLRLIIAIALLGGAGPARADQFDTLRLKWGEMLTQGTNAIPADPLYAGWLSTIARDAQRHWNNMATNPARTFLWSDLNQLGTDSSHVTASYARLRAMAMGHAVRGSSLETNSALRAVLISGLDWMYTNHYNETVVTNDNWFDWQIGTPLRLNDITVLLYPHLTGAQVGNYMNAVNRFTPVPDMTGANEVWKASVVALRGAIVKNSSKISAARQALSDVFPYTGAGDGFYTDGSFLFHDVFPYNGGYGADLIATLGPLLHWLDGSTWEVADPARTNVFRWVHDSFQPFIYRGAMMEMVAGRYYTRDGDDHASGHDVIASILRLAQFAPPADATAFKRMARDWIAADTARNFIDTQPPPYNGWAKSILDDTNLAPRGELTGHWQFPRMDRAVHLRPGWGLGLSLSSSRVGNYESTRGENLRGWYTGDGMTWLYTADLKQFSEGFWQSVDPYRLPGTTVDTQPRADGSGEGDLPNDWVGGASLDGLYGVSGFHLNAWGSTLSARKSWFMFDNEVVCLGAGITSTDNRPVETIVENRRLGVYGNNPFTVNGAAKPAGVGWAETLASTSWAHLEGTVPGSDIGYYFPQPATVSALREARSGSLHDLNTTYGSTNRVTGNFLTLWLDHGPSPANAGYSYVLLPGRAPAQTAGYAASPDITVIENTTRVQAVRENTLGITAVNFWRDGSNRVSTITSDRKAAVIFRHDGTLLDVAVVDPTQTNGGVINIEIAFAAGAIFSSDPEVTVLQSSPTLKLEVDVNGSFGRTLRAKFYAGPVQTLTLSPEADAYVQNGDQTNVNFGGAITLGVKSSGASQAREAYLKFDLAAAQGLLFDAKLRLVPNSVENPISHALALVGDNAWGEATITWKNRPASAPEYTRWLVPSADTPVLVPLTSLVEPVVATAAVAGQAAGKLSLRIYSAATPPPTNSFVSYRSRENGSSSDRPQLNLSLGRIPPSVSLAIPAGGTLFDAPASVTLSADAQDWDGSVIAVDFYRGNGAMATRVGQSLAAPYSCVLPGLAAGEYSVFAVAVDNMGLMATSAPVTLTVFTPEPAGRGTGLFGEYYVSENLTGLVLTRTDSTLNFLWGAGSPAIQVPNDRFSVRWTGQLQPRRAGWHSFHTVSDEGIRLWIDGRLVIDRWADHALAEDAGGISLVPGRYYNIGVEYHEGSSNATAQLYWTQPGGVKEIVPQGQLYPANHGLRGSYFANTNLANLVAPRSNLMFTRIDRAVVFGWGNSTPEPALLSGGFSVRWTGRVRASQAGLYTFFIYADDGVILTVNGLNLISNAVARPPTLSSNSIMLSAGQHPTLVLDYANYGGPAGGGGTVVLWWARPGGVMEVVPNGVLAVSQQNNPPVLAPLPDLPVAGGSLLAFTAAASDLDGPWQQFSYTLEAGAPAGAGIHGETGLFTWAVPGAQAVGDYPVTVRVTDNGTPVMTDAQTFVVRVGGGGAVLGIAQGAGGGPAGGAVLSWPEGAGAQQLYLATNLAPPVAWVVATNVAVLSNGFWRVLLPAGTEPTRFYRLQSQ